MPNTKSAKKALKVSLKNRLRNQSVRSRMKTMRRKALEAIQQDAALSEEAVKQALKEFDIAASKGVIHRNAAARYKSRLMHKLNAVREA